MIVMSCENVIASQTNVHFDFLMIHTGNHFHALMQNSAPANSELMGALRGGIHLIALPVGSVRKVGRGCQ
jgi:hypothetical protein